MLHLHPPIGRVSLDYSVKPPPATQMAHEEVAATAQRHQVVRIELQVGCHVERDDVVRLESFAPAADCAEDMASHVPLTDAAPGR